MLDVSPYGNYIVTKELSGKEILEILETSLDIMKANIEANEKGDYDGWPDNSGNTLQAGGIEVKYNLSLEKGSRILGVLVQGEAVQGDKMYTVAMNNYLPNDTSDYPQFEGKANLHEYQACEDALAAYLSQPENVVLEGISRARLVATNEKPAVDEKPGQDGNDNQEGSKPKPAVPAPENEKAPDNKTPKNKTPDNKINSVRTGDDVNIELYLLLTLAGIGGAAATLRKKYGTQGN